MVGSDEGHRNVFHRVRRQIVEHHIQDVGVVCADATTLTAHERTDLVNPDATHQGDRLDVLPIIVLQGYHEIADVGMTDAQTDVDVDNRSAIDGHLSAVRRDDDLRAPVDGS